MINQKVEEECLSKKCNKSIEHRQLSFLRENWLSQLELIVVVDNSFRLTQRDFRVEINRLVEIDEKNSHFFTNHLTANSTSGPGERKRVQPPSCAIQLAFSAHTGSTQSPLLLSSTESRLQRKQKCFHNLLWKIVIKLYRASLGNLIDIFSNYPMRVSLVTFMFRKHLGESLSHTHAAC